MAETAELILDGKSITLPVIEGTEHEKAFDIGKLRDQTGYVTLDSGYKNTGATKSAITFLDGEEGILRYRGYPIEQLAEKSSFLEVAYLLIYGALPTQAELDHFSGQITKHTLVHEDMRKIFDGFPSATHPMAILSSLICALTGFYPQSVSPDLSPEEMELNIIRLLAKMPTIAAWTYKNNMGHPLNYPRNDMDYCANFLYMMFSFPTEKYEGNPVVVRALNKLLILHADHEQNCSTSTGAPRGLGQRQPLRLGFGRHQRPVGDRCTAGPTRKLSKCWKPLRPTAATPASSLPKPRIRIATFRLMGFGHRVYKNFDPRAKIIKVAADEVLQAPWYAGQPFAENRARSWSRPPSRTSISSSASCTRTLTSIPASFTKPWASPPRCSRLCSPWAACPAGLPSGKRCARTRSPSAAPARFTPVSWSATTKPSTPVRPRPPLGKNKKPALWSGLFRVRPGKLLPYFRRCAVKLVRSAWYATNC